MDFITISVKFKGKWFLFLISLTEYLSLMIFVNPLWSAMGQIMMIVLSELSTHLTAVGDQGRAEL